MNKNQRDIVRALIGASGLLAAHHVRQVSPRQRLGEGVVIALLGFAVSEEILSRSGGMVFLQALAKGLGA